MIAVQTAVGGIGSKATTELSSSYMSMVDCEGLQFGLGEDGIHLLNSGDLSTSAEFTLATTDFGINKTKLLRFLDIGIEAFGSVLVSIKFDDGAFHTYTLPTLKSGLQNLRLPMRSDKQGRYVTVKLSSSSFFRIDNIDVAYIARPSGIRGY